MHNLTVLRFAATLLLQTEMHNFFATLLNDNEKRTLVVMYIEETKVVTDSIVLAAATHGTKVELINLELDPLPTKRRPHEIKREFIFSPDVVLLVMLGTRQQQMVTPWLREWHQISPSTKIMWFLPYARTDELSLTLPALHTIKFWYNLVLINANARTGQLMAYRLAIFTKTPTIVNPRDGAFAAPGAMFDALFIKEYSNFGGLPLNIFSEPDVPTVVFANTKRQRKGSQRWVLGSDVSLAILIGRYLNASVRFYTGFDYPDNYKVKTKEQGQQFKQYMEPTFEVSEQTMKDTLPWIYHDQSMK